MNKRQQKKVLKKYGACPSCWPQGKRRAIAFRKRRRFGCPLPAGMFAMDEHSKFAPAQCVAACARAEGI